MCGIVGYVGDRTALPFLIDGLKKLEYRGYDSAGVAMVDGHSALVEKCEGRIQALEKRLLQNHLEGKVGIGHTRWATHGKPSDTNAHPHTDCEGEIAVVHNGIIENYARIREFLQKRGHVFRSETDTEVMPHLIEHYYEGSLEQAVQRAAKDLHGSYAMAVVSTKEPDKIVAVRNLSPLIVGLGQGENYLASDIPALLNHTRETIVLEDGEMAVITCDSVRVLSLSGEEREKKPFFVPWDPVQAERGGYPHFMLKEIHEQPGALSETLRGRLSPDGKVVLTEMTMTEADALAINRVFLVACGTAFHASMVGKHFMERIVGIPAEVDLASEFRYRNPVITPGSLLVVVSQSGETADTLAALREGKARGCRVIAITNVVGSSVAREADDVIYTWAGPEIAVASTKAYTTQVEALSLLALYIAQMRGRMDVYELNEYVMHLRMLPRKAQETLERCAGMQELAKELAAHDDVFFIGRGVDYASALEGQLKLKEISYIHAEAYAAGELKHGTLALITEGVPVIALATQKDVLEKMVSNITEVRARGARVIIITTDDAEGLDEYSSSIIRVPHTHPLLMPVLTAIPQQLLAYYAAVERGCDVDKPRNLAKSVTVE
ncbi:MAG: glutamine--fructose-6-phosphate transaminase (isomerizing) [Bacillota bacterium]